MKIAFPLVLFVVLIFTACETKKEVVSLDYEEPKEEVQKEEPLKMVTIIQDETADLNEKTDAFQLVKMEQKDNQLLIEVRYGGGCRDHEFKLVHIGAYKESMPPQLDVALRHNANDDRCRALVTETLSIPLDQLRYPGSDQLVLNFQLLNISRTIKY